MDTDVAIIGAGSIGIATAYYLARNHGITDIALIDQGQPMAFTSAQSGENYRNWWPHPLLVALADRSIDLLEEIADETDNRINMTRRGYVLATRGDVQPMLDELAFSLGDAFPESVRTHEHAGGAAYQRADSANWRTAPNGFDLLLDRDLIRSAYPYFDASVRAILHVRRGGDISSQQLGTHMLERLGETGLRRERARVEGISGGFVLHLRRDGAPIEMRAARIVNAAGPFAGEVARMVGVDLPVHNVLQQKMAFPDTAGTIPRNMPFAIDMDPQLIDWADDEREVLMSDPDTAWLAREMPGAIHCRPDGGDAGTWVKLGWAYNETPAPATFDVPLDNRFPEIVLRGASRLNPALKAYFGRLPRGMHHFGGWYTRTRDNWPLIGAMGPEGAFMNCAMSGHGTMMSCAAGELAAAWVAGGELPDHAEAFSLARFRDPTLVPELEGLGSGLL